MRGRPRHHPDTMPPNYCAKMIARFESGNSVRERGLDVLIAENGQSDE